MGVISMITMIEKIIMSITFITAIIVQTIECWSARELMEIFNYAEWRNFLKVVEKARDAAKNTGENVNDHFVDVNKMIRNEI